ncbi:MAG: hypothetical protein QOG33_1773 [Gaiellales bacterium]|nr:hypothetical protein [Gaiellales bacterium]
MPGSETLPPSGVSGRYRAAVVSVLAVAISALAYFAFDLDDWNYLSKGQVEQILAKQHHATSVHCTDIPNDGDETLQGYEYTCFVKAERVTFGVWVAVNSSRITETEGMG